MFFSFYTGVAPPTCFYYKLLVYGIMEPGSVSVTMKQTCLPVNSKMQQKITFNFVLCQVRLILFNTNLNTKNNISLVKTIPKRPVLASV